MKDEPRRKTRYRGERCTSKLTLNADVHNRTRAHLVQGGENRSSEGYNGFDSVITRHEHNEAEAG